AAASIRFRRRLLDGRGGGERYNGGRRRSSRQGAPRFSKGQAIVDLGLRNKVVLVTGGARGIGRAVSGVLAAEGAIPVIVGQDAADNEAAVRAIVAAGGRAHAFLAELTRTEECRAAVEATVAHFGRIDALVNNAGVNDRVGLE